MHLHSGAASGLRPCLCRTSAAPEGPPRSPGRRGAGGSGGGGGGSGSDSEGVISFAGVLFLQFGEETRRVHITHEVSSLDTLHALIAHMFPQKLTMGMLKSPNTAILIKDEARNVFYELEDVRWAWPRGGVGFPRLLLQGGLHSAGLSLSSPLLTQPQPFLSPSPSFPTPTLLPCPL